MNHRKGARALAVALAFTIFPASLSAQDHGGHHANHIGLFLGATRLEGHSSFTIGADYERRLPVAHDRLAVGALIDAAVGKEPNHVIVAGTISLRPVNAFKLLVAPGVEFANGHREALLRVGAAVDLPHIGVLTVSPGVYLDFVGGHRAVVYGVTFGTGF